LVVADPRMVLFLDELVVSKSMQYWTEYFHGYFQSKF
jgi:Leu/Phe-tRNA-protein transferase